MEPRFDHLHFKPIDFAKDGDACIRFSEEAHIASFGNADRFHEVDSKGAERYLAWLKGESKKDPLSCVHIWLVGKIVGQVVIGRYKFDPDIGYVNLYYLIPEQRGSGLARRLDAFACDYLKNLGLSLARLSVSPSNLHALAIYRKLGWRDLGPRSDRPDLNLMEKEL